jgi:hypothetical protein
VEQRSYVGEQRSEQHVNIITCSKGFQSGIEMFEVLESHQVLPPCGKRITNLQETVY